ncbi:MAG: EAL domain-containing protein [Methylococcaceae bacterium]|jgi:diguanylate cyclase (GGDEF)-like protein/PAS domain S-box-containing protein
MNNFKKNNSAESARLQQLYSVSYASLMSSTLLGVILAYIQHEVIDAAIVITWLTLLLVSSLFRAALAYNYQQTNVDDDASKLWLFRFRLGVLVGSLVWGSASILMFAKDDLSHQLFLIFIIAGLSVGGVVSYAADMRSALIFSSATLTPLALHFFMQTGNLAMAMGAAVTLYFGFIIISLRHINLTITDNIVLRQEAIKREDSVRIKEERYRLLLNHSPVGIFHFDTHYSITYCNEHFSDILKKSVAETIGLNINDLQANAILPTLTYALKGKTLQFEGQFCANASDSNIWIDMSCAPSRNADGKIVGGVAIVRDITDRKQAEEMLRISAIAFESQSGMIVTSADSVILRVNQAFTKMSGYSALEVIGKTPNFLNSGRHNKSFFKAMWQTLKDTGYWQGEIWNQHKNGMVTAEWLTISAVKAPDGRISHYIGTYSDITQNKDAVAEIHRLAYYDPLTNLPNRRLLQDRLGQELAAANRSGMFGAIMFLDLDNFKTLNDTRGHSAGDQLLVEVARRLRSVVREGDVVGRLGGDEFVVILENLSSDAKMAALLTKQIGEKILVTLAKPYIFENYEFHCTTSIGIRLFRENETVEELLKHADLAMYQAKTAGRNTLRFFDPDMQAVVTHRANLEKELRSALELDQLKLYFQPQLCQDRKVGAEALLRWQHPERGLVMPLDFIELAEKSHLILPIGEWVLKMACAQLKAWENQNDTHNLQLAINVSARQFRQPNFVMQIQDILSHYAIKPERLKLELTENLILDNIYDTVEKMHLLREIGVQFSLDDFGTGYSSFAYLTQLPLDQLKIDRSFIHNIGCKPTDAVIVETIIGMAHSLKIEAMAEGVETPEQLAFLEYHGCAAYQGFLFSQPLPIQEFEQLMLT